METVYVVQIVRASGITDITKTNSELEAEARYEHACKVVGPDASVRMLEIGATGGRILRDSQRDAIVIDKPVCYEDDGNVLFNVR